MNNRAFWRGLEFYIVVFTAQSWRGSSRFAAEYIHCLTLHYIVLSGT